ncbi:MAG: response regulator, partial [Deltaproteobacteria bacterium]|nr:response regulator [Deltaproteobacteria bacterium]
MKLQTSIENFCEPDGLRFSMLISVLLIEDDPDFGELVKFILSATDSPIRVLLHWERSLSNALRYLSQSSVDLILVDLGLPDSAGPATVEKLTAFANNTPFIVLSAEDRDSAIW